MSAPDPWDLPARARLFAEQVLAGDVPACDDVQLAAARFQRLLGPGAPEGIQFCEEAVGRFAATVQRLRQFKGTRDPLMLTAWQAFVTAQAFGFLRPNGKRWMRDVVIRCSRKQGKTTIIGSAIAHHATADDEPAPECYTFANSRDQATIAFRDARTFIRQLDPNCDWTQREVRLEGEGVVKPLPAEEDRLDGLNTHAYSVDEAAAARSRACELLSTSTGARQQPLGWWISTPTSYMDQTVFGEEIERGQRILRGEIPEAPLLLFNAHVPDQADPHDRELWPMGNPSLHQIGPTMTMAYLVEQYEKMSGSPARFNEFRRLHLAQRTEAMDALFSVTHWGRCPMAGEPDPNAETWLGIDLSRQRDLTALVAVQRDGDGLRCWPTFWCVGETVRERSKKHALDYAAQDSMQVIPGDAIDFGRVFDEVRAWTQRGNVVGVGIDPRFATELARRIEDELSLTVEKIGQSPQRMGAAVHELERLILRERIAHNRDPILSRHVAGTTGVAREDGSHRLDRSVKGNTEIDGTVALAMAALLASEAPEASLTVFSL